MPADFGADGADPSLPADSPHPFPDRSPQNPPVFPGRPLDPYPYAWGAGASTPPPPPSPRKRGWLFYAGWTAAGVLAAGLTLQAVSFAITAVTDIAEASAALTDESGTVLSDSWEVDGIDVIYVEEGGTDCEAEHCWEWLLMTQPDCASVAVTVEIFDDMLGETTRRVEQSIATERVTSVVVQAQADDGEYADLTTIDCQ